MYVPSPPVVAYRGSALIREDPLHWTIFRTEWTALVFGRWIADIHFRGLLWRLPSKVRAWVNQLGIATLTQGSTVSVSEAHSLLTDHDAVDWTRYEVIVSDSVPEDGIVRVHVAPVLYNKGKISLETLVRSTIPRLPATAFSSPAAPTPPLPAASMKNTRATPAPALRSAPAVSEGPYVPQPTAVPTQPEPEGALADYDPYAPPPVAAPTSGWVPPSSSMTMQDPYLPAPPTHRQLPLYAVDPYAPGGGARASAAVATGGNPVTGNTDYGRLYNLLSESGHANMLSRWPDSYGRVGVDSVAAYIHYLDSECRRLTARVRNMEELHHGVQEQLYEDRRARVTWLSGALHDATQLMNEPPRKRRRDHE
jgi:hypothetical protein